MVDAVTNYNTSFLGASIASGGNADALKTTGLPVTVSSSAPPTPGQALVATSATNAEWVDISVPLVDALTFITDQNTPSNRIGFDATGSGGTTLTLQSATTANRVITFPDRTDTLVSRNSTDTLTNKTLTLPVIAQISNTGTLSLPNTTDTLTGRATTDSMTNKTITDPSNNVAANSLKTTGASVNVASAAPPTAGQILRATSATTAVWSPETVTTLSNQGTSSLLFTGTGPNLAIKGLLAGNGINITPLANDLQLTADYSNVVDANLTIVDSINNTRTLKFDVNGSPSTLTTLATTSSANRTLQLPDINDILVTRTNNETLTNKSVIDNTFNIRDDADNSIRINFDASGVTGTSTTILANQGANRVIELPDQSTELIGDDSIHTLTNKTIDDASNIVAASALRTTGASVVVSGAAPPIPGYILKCVTPTSAEWAPDASGAAIDNVFSIVDNVDSTRRISFDAAGTTGTTTTLVGSQTVNRSLTLPDISDTLVTRTATETLSNKSLVAANTSIVDLTTSSKRITFDCVNNQPNMRTILSTNAVITNQTFIYPAITATDTLVTNGFQANLTNKTLDDASVLFRNTLHSSRTVRFSVSNTANNTQLTIATPITASRTLTLPDATDTLAVLALGQTLTNKTITDAGSNVAANSLKTTGASVTVSTAAPPTAGQILRATSATSAAWSNDDAGTPATLSSLGGQTSLLGSTNTADALAVKSLQAGDYMYLDTSVADVIKIHDYGSSFSGNKPVSDTQDLFTLHGKNRFFYLQNTNASNLAINVLLPITSFSATPTATNLRIGDSISITSAPGSVNFINVLDPENLSIITQIYTGQTKQFFARSSGAGGYVVMSVKGDLVGASSNNIVFGSGHLSATSTNTISLKGTGLGNNTLTSCISIGSDTLNNSTSTGSVVIGHLAASLGTIGNNIVAVGTEACKISTDQFAIGLGYRSGFTGLGDASIAIGREACRDVKSLAGSISIGRLANETVAAGVSSIAIGDRATNNNSNAILLGSLSTTLNPYDVIIGNDVTFSGTNGRSLFLQGVAVGAVPSGSIIMGISNLYPNTTAPNDIIIVGKSNSVANQTNPNGGQMLLVGRGNTVGTSLITNTNINIFGSTNIIDNTIIGDISIFGSGNVCNTQSGSSTIVVGLNNTNVFGSNVIFGISNISQASSQFCVAIGRSNTVSTLGTNTFPSIAVGTSCIASANGGGGLAVGYQSNSTAPRSVALGFQAEAKTICTNIPQPIAVKPSGSILQSDAHHQFGSAVCSYSTTNITGTGTFDFTIGTDSQLLFCPFSIMVTNVGAGTGNLTLSIGTPADVTLYRVSVNIGTLTAYQMWSEEMTNARRQNTRALGVTGNTTLRVNVTAWSTTLAPFLPRVTIIGHAYQL